MPRSNQRSLAGSLQCGGRHNALVGVALELEITPSLVRKLPQSMLDIHTINEMICVVIHCVWKRDGSRIVMGEMLERFAFAFRGNRVALPRVHVGYSKVIISVVPTHILGQCYILTIKTPFSTCSSFPPLAFEMKTRHEAHKIICFLVLMRITTGNVLRCHLGFHFSVVRSYDGFQLILKIYRQKSCQYSTFKCYTRHS